MGEYRVAASMTPLEVFGLLGSGKSIQHLVTIREGQNMYEVADALAKEGLAERDRVIALLHALVDHAQPLPNGSGDSRELFGKMDDVAAV
jgi:cell division protein YceG involved in septum cleavage